MSNEPRAGTGLDPELLAAYIDQRLTPEQRRRVEAQLANDPDNYAVLVETMKALDANAASARVSQSRRLVIAAGAAAAAAMIALAVWMSPAIMSRLRGERVDPRFERLVSAVGAERYIDARLTGGFKYGPLRQATRGTGELSQQNLELLAAAGELQKRAQSEPSLDNLHAWGVAQTLLADYDGSIATLRKTSSDASASAAVFSDLAAALLARGTATDRPEDFAEALSCAERAIKADPALVESYYNKAVALELLRLDDAATDAWADYARRDSSPWSERARRGRRQKSMSPTESAETLIAGAMSHQNDLDGRVKHAPELGVRAVEEVLPLRWAAAVQSGDFDGARSSAAAAVLIGKAISAISGDDLATEIARYLSNATIDSAPQVSLLLSRYGESLGLLRAYRFREAALALRPIAEEFERQHSPMEAVVKLSYAGALRSAREMDEAAAVLNNAEPSFRPYPCLRARALRIAGLAYAGRGNYPKSLASYDAAIQQFGRCGFRLLEAQSATLSAEILGLLGSSEAWRQQILAGNAADYGATPRDLQPVYYVGGTLALSRQWPDVAAHFFSAMLKCAEVIGTPAAMAEARLNRAKAYLAAGQHALLEADIAAAEQLLSSSDAAEHSSFVKGGWKTIESEYLAGRNPTAAVAAAEEAEDIARRHSHENLLPAILLARGVAKEHLGEHEAAIDSFRSGVVEVERRLHEVTEPSLRVSLIDSAWSLYSMLANSLADANRVGDALAVVEQSVGRSFLDGSGTPVATIPEIQARLRPRAALVYFLPAKSRTLVWVVTKKRVQMFSSNFDADHPATDASADWQSRAELGQRLISPLLLSLTETDSIGLIMTGSLALVPWSAVRLNSGQIFGERYTLALLPNGSYITRRPRRDRQDGIVVVGASRASKSALNQLPDLPAAASEASGVAAMYPGATLLLDDAATPVRVLKEVAHARLFHFAGHSIANDRYPELSQLVVGDGESIFARDLMQSAQFGLQVAVLSACGTASGALPNGEGPLSFARLLLSAGVDAVVGSQRVVDDDVAEKFSVEMHRSFAAGVPIAAAVRSATLALRQSGVPAQGWSSFVLIGGTTHVLTE